MSAFGIRSLVKTLFYIGRMRLQIFFVTILLVVTLVEVTMSKSKNHMKTRVSFFRRKKKKREYGIKFLSMEKFPSKIIHLSIYRNKL